MTEFAIEKITGVSLSKDGRNAILHLQATQGESVELKLSVLTLQKVMQDATNVLASPNLLSQISNQGVLQFQRPQTCRGSLTIDGTTVVISFLMPGGLEIHYGLQPNLALELGKQIHEAAEKGKTTKPPLAN